jgi:transposase
MKTFKNIEYGIEAQVTGRANRFAVALLDTDAEMYIDQITIYENEEDAIAYAQKLVA